MCMVKANSYGTGSFEVANTLQNNGVDFLGVAIADEGKELREAGITVPIIVMNPNKVVILRLSIISWSRRFIVCAS